MRIIQAIFILRHALGWRILLRFGVSKFQEIPGTSRYVADAREFHVRRISRSALCACIRADASRQAFRGAIRISCARVLITNSRVLRGERSYAEKKKEKNFISRLDPFHGSPRDYVCVSRPLRQNQSVISFRICSTDTSFSCKSSKTSYKADYPYPSI